MIKIFKFQGRSRRNNELYDRKVDKKLSIEHSSSFLICQAVLNLISFEIAENESKIGEKTGTKQKTASMFYIQFLRFFLQ